MSVPSTTATAAPALPIPLKAVNVWDKAVKRAIGGGVSGAAAMGVQVLSLMWLRTTMNYQYRYGSTMKEALAILYKDGGIRRFYRGLAPALIQGPASRLGDTAANTGILVLMDSYEETKDLPVMVKTVAASATAALWRIFLMPVDTLKTTLQVNGSKGMPLLAGRMATHGVPTLYYGAVAASTATFVGHYPWFATYNILNANLPKPDSTLQKLGRNAIIGFTASAVSDTISNSIRVVKTYRQTYEQRISYGDTVRAVVQKDGVIGLFGRGLKTRIFTNGLQGLMFTVLWKAFEEKWNQQN